MKRTIAFFLAMIMAMMMVSAISVSAYTVEMETNEYSIRRSNLSNIVGTAQYTFKYDSSMHCFEAHNILKYEANSDDIPAAQKNFPGYIRLTIKYKDAQYSDWTQSTARYFTANIYNDLPLYAYVPAGRAVAEAEAYFTTNTETMVNNVTYFRNNNYEFYYYTLIMINP